MHAISFFFTSINTTVIIKENKLSLHPPYAYQIIKTGKKCNLRKIIPLETLTVRISQCDYHTELVIYKVQGLHLGQIIDFNFQPPLERPFCMFVEEFAQWTFPRFYIHSVWTGYNASISSLIVDSSPIMWWDCVFSIF